MLAALLAIHLAAIPAENFAGSLTPRLQATAVDLGAQEARLGHELFERRLEADTVSVFLPALGILDGALIWATAYPLASPGMFLGGVALVGVSTALLVVQVVRKVLALREVSRLEGELSAVRYARGAALGRRE